TAVVAGTASATVGAMNNRKASKQATAASAQQAEQDAAEAQREVADLQAQLDRAQAAAPVAPAPAPAAGGDDMIAKLQQLADLKNSGVLDDAEFAAAKAKLLAG
ncbi:SHOCT domain-containing protein, partial [Ilumatobacter sp.]|uniref:SHOCT domain-containing protein n=1 Tax=Ilumatobacter sp. TaxID=1967498 RepID=UPI003C342A2B